MEAYRAVLSEGRVRATAGAHLRPRGLGWSLLLFHTRGLLAAGASFSMMSGRAGFCFNISGKAGFSFYYVIRKVEDF